MKRNIFRATIPALAFVMWLMVISDYHNIWAILASGPIIWGFGKLLLLELFKVGNKNDKH